MPLQATSGAASYDAFGGGVPVVPNYIEEVFSTWLYTGNSTTGGTQTITNSIDLSTKGGMVWIKGRSAASDHILTDTSRGAGTTASNNQALASNLAEAEDLGASYDFLSAFNVDGFTVKQGGTTAAKRGTNYNAVTYASWTFRKQPKFFDVVTYTGNGTSQAISHNLGSVPAVIIIKRFNNTGNWQLYHRSLGNTKALFPNTTDPADTWTAYWNDTSPTSTQFTVGSSGGGNASGDTYVAYLFAHDAGGFGLSGTDNVISCGSFTTDGSGNATVSLGYEAQWVLMKKSSGAEGWMLFDNMRGLVVQPVSGNFSRKLIPNATDAESDGDECRASSTGFNVGGVVGGATYIYIAIRRGPMKVPTSGTSVFDADVYSGTGTSGVKVTTTFPVDLAIIGNRTSTETYNQNFTDRLRGPLSMISSPTTSAQLTTADWVQSFAFMDGFNLYNDASVSASGTNNHIAYSFRRSPSFFDVVCYTGTGSLRTVTHNLAAVPELMIVKRRNTVEDWNVYNATIGNTAYLRLNTTAASATAGGDALWGSTTPTSSVFTVKTSGGTNASGGTYVAYLFATCAGVSKVGGYTGTAALQTVNCGFTSGARFVLIKRTDSTGDWWLYDSARGITSGNDPYVFLNSTAAEVTSTNYVDTDTTGFKVTAAAPAGLNASGGTFIFLAIA